MNQWTVQIGCNFIWGEGGFNTDEHILNNLIGRPGDTNIF